MIFNAFSPVLTRKCRQIPTLITNIYICLCIHDSLYMLSIDMGICNIKVIVVSQYCMFYYLSFIMCIPLILLFFFFA